MLGLCPVVPVVLEVVRVRLLVGPFATAFLGQFGRHTLALTVPPTSQGVRVRQ